VPLGRGGLPVYDRDMEFIDMRGASGTAYRFRRWPASGAHPPIAGNFVLVAADTRKVLELGMLEDLSQARAVLEKRPKGAELFTRFNISRSHREAEHNDVAQLHPDLGGSTPVSAASQAA
jgi:hypothetical protein